VTDSDGILAGPTERIGSIRAYREGAEGGGMFTDYPLTPPFYGKTKEETLQTNIECTLGNSPSIRLGKFPGID